MKYNFNFSQQILQGAVAFILTLLIVYFFNGEWNWGLALGVGIGNFIASGINY